MCLKGVDHKKTVCGSQYLKIGNDGWVEGVFYEQKTRMCLDGANHVLMCREDGNDGRVCRMCVNHAYIYI